MPNLERPHPPIAISSMIGGIGNGVERLGIPIEQIAWRGRNGHNPKITGIHASPYPDIRSALVQFVYPELTFIQKLEYLAETALMQRVNQTIEEGEKSAEEIYIVCHPDTAAYVYLQIASNRLQVPPNVAIAVENDEWKRQSRYLRKVSEGEYYDPCYPETVGLLAEKLKGAGVSSKRVLDIEHLRTSYPRMSLETAVRLMGGQVDILHVSGEMHRGCTIEQIKDYVSQTNPGLVVLEGPVAKSYFWMSKKELLAVKTLINQYTGRET